MAAAILVLADNSTILENLGLSLLGAGYEVATARDGRAAIAVLETQTIDLVVSDVAAPGPDGMALFERARQDPRWVALPFLLITGHDLPNCLLPAGQPEARLYRPIQPEELLAAVDRLLMPEAGVRRNDPPSGQCKVRQSQAARHRTKNHQGGL